MSDTREPLLKEALELAEIFEADYRDDCLSTFDDIKRAAACLRALSAPPPQDSVPAVEMPILEALIDKWNTQAAACTVRSLYDSGWVDAKGQCATDATLKMLAATQAKET